MIKPLRIVFLGTPEFALPTLEALVAAGLSPIAVITQPDRPVGRKQILTPPPVKISATAHHITVEQPQTKKELIEVINRYAPDVCVLVAFGMIIPDAALESVKHGFVNVHPSLLPKYRGSSPIQTALRNGDAVTGVSIIPLTHEVDAGPIIAQEHVSIEPTETYDVLSERLAQIGAQLLVKNLQPFVDGVISPVPQDEAGVVHTTMITREDGQVRWDKSARAIFDQFRAFYPWPGIFTMWAGKRLKIEKMSLLEGVYEGYKPGMAFLTGSNQLAIMTGQGALAIEQLQLEGSRSMTAREFLAGNGDIVGTVLGV